MTLVADTGPLIALAKIDALRLLKGVFGTVLIPPAVQSELLAKVGPESTQLSQALTEFIRVKAPSTASPEIRTAVSRRHPGERDALLLAHELHAPLLIDERAGRAVARSLEIDVVGVAGLLIRAKQTGLIVAAVPLLENMRQQRYWLSDALIEAARRLSGEDD